MNEKDKRVQAAMAFALTSGGRPALERIFAALADPDTADQALDTSSRSGRRMSRKSRPACRIRTRSCASRSRSRSASSAARKRPRP